MLGSTVQRVVTRSFDGEGGVTLKFNYDEVGRGYTGQPEARANSVFNVLTQLSGVAQRANMADPRIAITHEVSPARRWSKLGVSFDRPVGVEDEELAEKLQAGMLQAAALLRLNRTQDIDQENIGVFNFERSGLVLRARGLGVFPVLAANRFTPRNPDRIELSGEAQLSDTTENHARLIALSGIISVLDPIE
jgi:hypothetical protein